jgi:hypothetical protein
MTEQEMKLRARLYAMEHVLTNTMAILYLLCGFTREQIVEGHQATFEGLSKETLPGADPAQADMWMDELQQAVASLQSQALQSWEEKRREN